MSLRAKILLLFLLLAIAPLLAVAGSAYVQSQRALRELMEGRIATLAGYTAQDLAMSYRQIDGQLERLGNEPWVRRILLAEHGGSVTGAAIDEVRLGLEALWPYVSPGLESIAIRGHDGEMLHRRAAPDAPPPTPSAPGCETTLDGGLLTVDHAIQGAEGETLGRIQARVLARSLVRPEVLEAPFGTEGFLAILERTTSRTVVVSGCMPGLDAGELLSRARATDGTPVSIAASGSRFTYGDPGLDRLGTFARLDTPPWTVVMTGGTEQFLGPFRELQNGYALFVALIALSTALAFSLLINQVMRSLEELGVAADRIGEGDLDPWLPPPSSDEVGRLSYAIGRMAERLRQMVRQVDRSSRMAVVGELASYLAHEIRNPLSSIKLNLQSLQRDMNGGALAADASHEVDVCLREVGRLERVVSSVLKLGNVQQNPMTDGSIHDLLVETRDLLESDLDRLDVKIHLDLRAENSIVHADLGELKGVFLNLILNAADAMPDGGSVRVRTEDGTAGRPTVVIHVTDDGPGVPAELRERIFEPFFTTKSDGSGIGLSLGVKSIEVHGGRMHLATPAGMGQGAHFTIELPLASSGPALEGRGRSLSLPTPSRETGLISSKIEGT